MSSWGRGGMVGVGKAIDEHDRTEGAARLILEKEHGTPEGHDPGTRPDLCGLCEEFERRQEEAP